MIRNIIIHNMTKTPSYYDWEIQFRSEKKTLKKKKKRITSIGIDEEDLKYFLKQWKTKNL